MNRGKRILRRLAREVKGSRVRGREMARIYYGCSFDLVRKDISSVGDGGNNLIRREQIVMEMVRNY